MSEFHTVAKASEIPSGKGRVCEIAGKQIAVFRVGGGFHAIDNTCPHRGGPLAEGSLDGETVVCPWHGFRFDLKTGMNADGMPQQVRCYPVRVEGENVQVGV